MIHRPLNQSGAMFGLDARIALGIFAILSMVAGMTLVLDLNNLRGKSLGSELADTGKAIEAINYDLREDMFKALDNPSEKNAFMSLYDNGVITQRDQIRGRWVGPYIKFATNIHPLYGEMVIQKRLANHNTPCGDPAQTCYLWLVYNKVKHGITLAAEESVDGVTPETQDPAITGMLQWNTGDEYDSIYYRASKALSMDSN